jgi:hypothetical protein
MKVKVFLTISNLVDYFLHALTSLTSSLHSFIYSKQLPQTTKHFKETGALQIS